MEQSRSEFDLEVEPEPFSFSFFFWFLELFSSFLGFFFAFLSPLVYSRAKSDRSPKQQSNKRIIEAEKTEKNEVERLFGLFYGFFRLGIRG